MAEAIYYEREYWAWLPALLFFLLCLLLWPAVEYDEAGEVVNPNVGLAAGVSASSLAILFFWPFFRQRKYKIVGKKYKYLHPEDIPREQQEKDYWEEVK
jgi:hypothetical protein